MISDLVEFNPDRGLGGLAIPAPLYSIMKKQVKPWSIELVITNQAMNAIALLLS